MLPHLYSTAVEFKKQQKDNPKFSLAHVPLRSVLALALFRELGLRLERVLNDSGVDEQRGEQGLARSKRVESSKCGMPSYVISRWTGRSQQCPTGRCS